MRSIAYVVLFVHFPPWLTWPAIGAFLWGAVKLAWNDWERIMSVFKGSANFWDYAVVRFMEEQQREFRMKRGHNLVLKPIPIYVIARRAGRFKRSYRSTSKSLMRLEKMGRVYEAKHRYWMPGERPITALPPDTAPVGRWASRY